MNSTVSQLDAGTDQQKACEKASDESQPEIVEEFIYWVSLEKSDSPASDLLE